MGDYGNQFIKDVNDLTILGERILAKPFAPEKSKGGIILPGSKESDSTMAIVVKCGPGCDDDVREGLGIVYDRYQNRTLEISGAKYHIIMQSDVLCTIENHEG